ncbi:hypothetical protein Cgig2_015061 [Carnegiea gigantea]|uniref:Uncharacterized protein n=1 Tax=Carnegiea gigantea TaxID=171969 RepID=A0A9Q1K5R3_9CARY|nr:hypothetical protein Cgig2_015061 [Carnegiea gigantea]
MKTLTRSQISPITVEKRQSEPSSITITRRKESRAEPLNLGPSQTFIYSEQDLSIVRINLNGFQDFNVLDLGQSQISQLDVFDSDVDENVEEPVEEDLESYSEGNEELDENEVLDELDLEIDTEQIMTLGHKDAYGNESYVIVSEMAKVFKQGRLWSRNRDGSKSLKEGNTFTCKKELLTVMKD